MNSGFIGKNTNIYVICESNDNFLIVQNQMSYKKFIAENDL